MSHKIGIFWDFLEGLDDRDRKNFLAVLGEDELIKFSSSQEEFALVTGGRDPKRDLKFQPERQKDVVFQDIKLEDIQKRFDEFKDSFPDNPTLENLKKLDEPEEPEGPKSIDELRSKSQPAVSVTINLGQVADAK